MLCYNKSLYKDLKDEEQLRSQLIGNIKEGFLEEVSFNIDLRIACTLISRYENKIITRDLSYI